ncbi:restriction endonuclease subunit S [Desulfobotulus sp.]|uniref:restriction endonuclease subunit S n=1 Tax=Desulfobotulus sp. TaxID=1940337 RepID=UPI002A36AEEB|nr:restriction endonuclease subunit S [Desulfobotulus sp.]MDY0162174.1 restriction endonuclease subunit S [Desulfobotulus sp.]
MNKQTAQLLEQHFDTAFAAPDGIAKLRELILTLAMQGHLVEQDPNDPPASELLKEIEAEKQRLVKAGKIKQPKPLPPIKPEDVPYDLPKGWGWVRLGEIGQTQTGTTPKSGDNSSYGTDIPFIKPADIRADSVDYSNEGLSISGVEKYGRLAPAGSSLMVCIGTIGKTNIINRDCSFNQQINAVTPYKPLFPSCIQQFIRSSFFQAECWKQSSSTTIAILNKGKWESIPVALPPLPEQHRIVARIDQLMACCDALEKLRKEREEKRLAVHAAAIKQLLDAPDGSAWDFIQKHFGELYTVKENVAELRKAILQLAIMGRLVPQDPNDQPASELLKEIEAEKQRLVKAGKIKKPKLLPPIKPEEVPYELPQGWEWVRLGEIVSLLGDGIHGTPTYDETGEYFFINGNNLSDGVIEIKENTKRVSITEYEKRKKELTDRTVLVSINGTIGNVAFYGGEPVMLGKSACYLNLFTQIEKHYIKKLINSSYFLEYAFKSATGSTIKNVSLKAMREFCIPLPPLPEQHRIVARIDQLMALCDILDQQIDAATGKQTELLNAVMAQV